ncbi:MAG: GNAT family N-acetyltransferase [Candidatus Cloacimonetes bacterium]|nr:GNAT family N-acetyltransferase [Candidatus Cloacimonadota bacterium]
MKIKAGLLPPIASSSIILRFFTPKDASGIYLMSQEPGWRRWLPDQVYDSREHALAVIRYLINQYREPADPVLAPYVLGVCLKGSGEFIGHVGLSPLDGQVEIGYSIAVKQQGKGYASEAVRTMAKWALPHFSLPRILGVVSTANVSSCRVLERAGFILISESKGNLHGRSGLVRVYEKTR